MNRFSKGEIAVRTTRTWLLMTGLFLCASMGCFGKNERPPATTTPPPRTIDTTPRPTTERPGTSGSGLESGSDDELGTVSSGEDITGISLDELNDRAPLADVPFEYDSAVLEDEARATLDRNADWLSRYPSVTVLIEGHCDERGTVEYNLALGERRSSAVYNYLMNLGIPASRLKTISYGKEFPMDPGHTEGSWARNRRAHFEITAK